MQYIANFSLPIKLKVPLFNLIAIISWLVNNCTLFTDFLQFQLFDSSIHCNPNIRFLEYLQLRNQSLLKNAITSTIQFVACQWLQPKSKLSLSVLAEWIVDNPIPQFCYKWFGMVTSNTCEAINSWLRDARTLTWSHA